MATAPPAIPLFRVRLPEGADTALRATLASGYIAQGRQVEHFEARLSEWTGEPRVCAVNDISGALLLALYLCGVRPGDDVVMPPMVCLATSMPVANLFARPVWTDVDPESGMPRPEHVRAALTARTRAILVTHWSGDVADLDGLAAVAREAGIPLVADASEAFGATYRGRRLGASEADFTAFSFGPVRQLTCGEGAALVVRSQEMYERLRWTRRFGIHQPSFRLPNGDLNPDSDIAESGYSCGFNDLAASLGLSQFASADAVVARYGENGRYFDRELSGIPGLTLLSRPAECGSGFWTYSFRAQRRAALIARLKAQGIGCQRLHLRNDRYRCFASSQSASELPGVALFDAENVSVPCGWWVSDEDRARVVDCIRGGW